jgi:hypothetical protein
MRAWTVALSVVVIGALAGCGDDGADPEASATVTETVTNSPTPTETTSAPPETETASATASPTEPPTEPPTESTAPPPVDLSRPPVSYEEAAAHIGAAREASGGGREVDRFQSADEKFYCSFGERFIRPSCEILDAVHDPDTCADSMSPNVGRIELTRRGWAPFCNTDTIRQPGAPVLDQGAVATWPAESVECVLEGIGLTCVETGGQRGFFLGPGRYQVF